MEPTMEPTLNRESKGGRLHVRQRLGDRALDLIFRKARTYNGWLNRPVSDATLKELYDLVKWGPTSANCCPARILFIRSMEAKARLLPCLNEGNIEKTRTAPVTAILGYDMRFYDKLPFLYPHVDARSWFVDNPELIQQTAFRNASLQGGYFILAARSLGLDCGPMSGFDQEKVEREFFGQHHGTDTYAEEHFPESHVRSNFICNLGYGDPESLHPRNPRLSLEEACVFL